ncbi:protein O-linked-mannose beta-1,2-N-acetylglucosaminyltransferase 1-like [Amphibalanus amphitrite]|uniref:protein O-linked-mannose beta-1,2-N-acetylglucosaminyltransferase 1-like n=1 Tax=Amphibalanus amphitrite TaxID=1232801 RepID=UPI001C90BA1D|nr:protein O-linked-mannose beta-1,2-N-acetylglucosaminyltransferase 1-like [Amphibalanus amphitrite]
MAGSVVRLAALLLSPLLLLHTTTDVAAAATVPDLLAVATDPDDGPELWQIKPSEVTLEVTSSGQSCEVWVGGRLLLHRLGPPLALHALSVNPRTGRATGHVIASGGVPAGAFVEMAAFIADLQPGSVIVLCQHSDAEMALDDTSDEMFRSLNASFGSDLQVRSALALVAVKDGPMLAEGYRPHLAALELNSTAPSVRLAVSLPVEAPCQPPISNSVSDRSRLEFCERYDGYGSLCDCDSPLPLPPVPRPFTDGELFPFPVIVVSAGRPRNLHRCLASLLANPGLDPARIVVITASESVNEYYSTDDSSDGDGEELRHLLQLYGVRWHPVNASPVSGGFTGGSLQHAALQNALSLFPAAEKLVLLEDSVVVSPDLLSFFQQTHHLLDIDVSLYGVSAGNELGYRHAVSDRTAVYRVDSAPGGAWLLTRRLVTDDILPVWGGSGGPEPGLSELLRLADLRLGRECIIPEVPRFYRFVFNQSDNGTDYLYHWDRALSQGPPVALRGLEDLPLPRYRRHLQALISSATKLDGTQSRLDCTEIVPRNATAEPLLLSVLMMSGSDGVSWQRAAACLGVWDRDPRGHHAGVWRLRHAGGGPLLVLAVPFSPLAGYATLHGRGTMLLVSAVRSAEQRRRGRWPLTLPRPGPDRVFERYRWAAAAAGLDRTQLGEELVRRGVVDHHDLTEDEDDGDLRMREMS